MFEHIINRDSPIPVYYQVATDIKNRIMHKEWGENGQIASENELVSQYGVSRVTLRQALAELEKDGLIKRYRGKGAFVNENPSQFIHELKYSLVTGNYETDDEQPLEAKILELSKISEPYKTISESLQLSSDASAIYFKRLFLLDKKPIAIGKSWIPSDLVPNLEVDGLLNNSLSQTIKERYHLNVIRVNDVLETVRPTLNDRKLLESTYDTPLILIKGISYLDNGRPLEYSNTFWLGDRVRFHISFENNQGRFIMHSS